MDLSERRVAKTESIKRITVKGCKACQNKGKVQSLIQQKAKEKEMKAYYSWGN